jgi:ABC-2 type transport system permease protein
MKKKAVTGFRIIRIYIRHFCNSAKIFFYYNDITFSLIGFFARDLVAIAVIYFITFRFGMIGGWEIGELLFLYSLLYISYGFSMLFFAGVRSIEDDIRTGLFDRYLVTPLSIFFQAIIAKVDLLTTLCYCTLGFILFFISADMTGISWTPGTIMVLVSGLIGGTLIQSALLLAGSIPGFWTIRTGQVKFMIFFNIRRLGIFPISIYPGIIKFILLYVFPFAFVNYVPAGLMAGKSAPGVWPFLPWGSLFIGLVLFGIVLFFWNTGIKNYKSTGN